MPETKMDKQDCVPDPEACTELLEESVCRYCLKNDPEEDLITPCLCKGSQKFVHRECLSSWMTQRRKNVKDWSEEDLCPPDGEVKSECEVCLQPLQGHWWKRVQPRLVWRSGIPLVVRRVIYTIAIFNLLCFLLSVGRVIDYWRQPTRKRHLAETVSDWFNIGLFFTSLTVFFGLLVCDRCPLLRWESYRWEWVSEPLPDCVLI